MQLMMLAGFNYIAAITGGFIAGILVSFLFNASLTFRSTMDLPIFARFLTVVAINYLITLVFVFLSLSMLENVLAGKILSLPVVAVNGFLLSKHWVFKS